MSKLGSRFRERASKVRERGSQERRNWDPSPDTAHNKLYQRWSQRTGKAPARENFCHYWRVVLLWAPLALLWSFIKSAYSCTSVKVGTLALILAAVIGGAAWLGSSFTGTMLGILLVVAVGLYVIIGAIGFFQLIREFVLEEEDDDELSWRWFMDLEYGVKCLFALVFSPVAVVAVALSLPVFSIAGFLIWVFDDKRGGAKLLYVLFEMHPARVPWLRLWLVFPLVLAIAALFFEAAFILATVVLGVLLLFAIVAFLCWLADTHKRNQEIRKKEQHRQYVIWRKSQMEPLLRELHARLHPKKAHNEECFQHWLSRYMRNMHLDRGYSADDFWRIPLLRHYVYHHIQTKFWPWDPEETVVTASKRRGVFSATADFLALIWAVIVASKWKICPIVEIKSSRE